MALRVHREELDVLVRVLAGKKAQGQAPKDPGKQRKIANNGTGKLKKSRIRQERGRGTAHDGKLRTMKAKYPAIRLESQTFPAYHHSDPYLRSRLTRTSNSRECRAAKPGSNPGSAYPFITPVQTARQSYLLIIVVYRIYVYY